jgi:cyclin B
LTRTAKVALGKPLSSELRDKLSLGIDRPFKLDEPAAGGILDTNFEDEMQNAEYAADIYRNLWKAEVRRFVHAIRCSAFAIHMVSQGNYSVSPNYMTQQADINERMRSILVDWLVDVHLKFKLRVETLFLTVHIIDRYLVKEQTTRNKLQLVGCTAMLVAAKYEEIYAPEVRDFVYISDKVCTRCPSLVVTSMSHHHHMTGRSQAYTREEIIAMEGKILNAIDWDLNGATPCSFFQRFCLAGQLDEKTKLTAQYLMERYLQELKSVQHLPSKIAAAAVSLALQINQLPSWVSAYLDSLSSLYTPPCAAQHSNH